MSESTVRRRLPRSFFARPSYVVAPELLGRVLVRIRPDGEVERSARVGIKVGIEHQWRFFERGSAFVSPGKPSVPVDGAERATGSRGS